MSFTEQLSICEIEQNLGNQIFCVVEDDQGKKVITFAFDSDRKYNCGLHCPLQHILIIYDKWKSLIPPSINEVSNLWSKTNVPDSEEGIRVYSKLEGSPADIFLALHSMNIKDQERINRKIKDAKKIMLFGAISAPSIVETAYYLETKGLKAI
ncbi:MAG: hypothetical protein NZM26_05235 [Patescibacteria group bacterium]|nr:hypothetical protein [Patescibacteria group bacterium]